MVVTWWIVFFLAVVVWMHAQSSISDMRSTYKHDLILSTFVRSTASLICPLCNGLIPSTKGFAYN